MKFENLQNYELDRAIRGEKSLYERALEMLVDREYSTYQFIKFCQRHQLKPF